MFSRVSGHFSWVSGDFSGHFSTILATFFVFWGIWGNVFRENTRKPRILARFPDFWPISRIWPDFPTFGRFPDFWPDFPTFGPDLARFGQIPDFWARSGQILGFRTILARGGPSSGILASQGGVRISRGAPNWHKSGGGGISCIRSLSRLSPGTYRSQILADSRIGARGTRNLGNFWEFSAEMDHFSGGQF